MANGYVGGKTGGFVGSVATAVTVALNSGLTGGTGSAVSVGDLVVVSVGYGTQGGTPSPAITTPTGYTPLTVQNADDSSDARHQVSFKFMGSTPDTSVDIPPSTSLSWAGTYTIQVFSGVDTTTPQDVAAAYATGINGGRPDPAAVTPSTPGAWIVVVGNAAVSSGSESTFTSSDLTNFLTSTGTDNTASMIGAGYYSSWTSGAFNPAAWTGGTTALSASWVATTLVLRPASGGSSVKTLAALGVG